MAVSGLIGCSEKFRDVLAEINMVAPVDCSVLVREEARAKR
jgi:transcriptional regulator with GAF, ATPase, and Fis domain